MSAGRRGPCWLFYPKRRRCGEGSGSAATATGYAVGCFTGSAWIASPPVSRWGCWPAALSGPADEGGYRARRRRLRLRARVAFGGRYSSQRGGTWARRTTAPFLAPPVPPNGASGIWSAFEQTTRVISGCGRLSRDKARSGHEPSNSQQCAVRCPAGWWLLQWSSRRSTAA